jgi:hypothetical protein
MATTFKMPWLLMVPRFRKPKVALFSRDFQWLRSDDELRRFLAASRDEGELVFVFYACAVYTGKAWHHHHDRKCRFSTSLL